MVYRTILDRSFSKHDRKKLTYVVSIGCLIMALGICIVGLNPIQVLTVRVSVNKILMTKGSKSNQYGNITGATSSQGKENLKTIPSTISEQKSIHIQTEKVIPARNTSQAKYSDDTAKTEKISKTSEPKPNNVQTEKPSPETSKAHTDTEKLKPICNTSQPRTDVCEMSGDIRIDGKSSTVFLSLPSTALLPEKSSWSIKPYPRKQEIAAMALVREFHVKMVDSQHKSVPHCREKHMVAGIVFSTTGYSGNHFHAFTDILIPLYITSREFNGEVKFLVTNHEPLWIKKHIAILKKLSNYELIDIDKENEVHCFPKMIVGLKAHKELNIDPSRSQQSMTDFRNLLREAYSLKKKRAIILSTQKADKLPRLLIIPRRRSRSFLNEEEIMNMGRNLGFEVIKAEADKNEARFASIVNSCDVMMGVHGAGLTNIVFLPEKAVFIQILPLGDMDWMAKTDFGEPSKSMSLRYLEYKIGENESSLVQQYPYDHPVVRDPHSISTKGWLAFKEVYLDKQNVKLDVGRFRGTLLKALKLLHD